MGVGVGIGLYVHTFVVAVTARSSPLVAVITMLPSLTALSTENRNLCWSSRIGSVES